MNQNKSHQVGDINLLILHLVQALAKQGQALSGKHWLIIAEYDSQGGTSSGPNIDHTITMLTPPGYYPPRSYSTNRVAHVNHITN